MYRPSHLSNPSFGGDQPGLCRGLARGILVVWGTVLVVTLSGCQPLAQLDELRTDFIALRYIQQATEAASEPVRAGRAVRCANRAVELASDNPAVLERAGRIYVYVGAYKPAISALKKAHLLTDRPYYYELGTAYLHTGQPELGHKLLSAHLQITKFGYTARRIPALAYAGELNNVGYAYAEAGVKLDLALKLTTQAAGLAPLNAAFVDSLGWAYYKLGDLKNATFFLERAVRQSLHQLNAELHYHLGAAYARLGRRDEATRELSQALQIRPHYPEVVHELRSLHWELAPPWHARVEDHHHSQQPS